MNPKRASGSGLLIVVLLLLVLGAGGWNYWRNLQEERARFRPYSGYSESDLAGLVAAYQQEIDGLSQEYAEIRGRRVEAKDTGLVGDQVQEFERVQRASRQVRDAGSRLSEREATLKLLRSELGYREAERDALQLHLRRLTTLPQT